MGREIRRVPPHWEHPRGERRNGQEDYLPMFDRDVQSEWEAWQDEYAAWLTGEHDRVIAEHGATDYPKDEPYRAFCSWHGGPPDPAYYRPKRADGAATWFQVYETVSEGTPVTPPFATKEELVEYLVANGDFWDQRRGHGGWDREAASRFVNAGWAPSGMVQRDKTGVVVKAPRDGIV